MNKIAGLSSFGLSLVLALVLGCGPKAKSVDSAPVAIATLQRPIPTPVEAVVPELAFPAEPFRGKQPESGKLKGFDQPPINRFTIGDGIDVYLVENHQLPTVSTQLVFPGGTIDDPKDKQGLASLCIALMRDGTEKLDKIALKEALADLASSVSSGVSVDEQSVTMSSLSRNLEPTLDLWVDTLLHPGMRADEFDRQLKRRKESIKEERGSPDGVAGRVTASVAFGEGHPFAQIVTEETLSKITLDDCKAHVRESIKPKGATLFVVGDLTRKQIEEKIGKRLASWKGAPKKRPTIAKPTPRAGKLFFVDVPGAPQSIVRVMHLGPKRNSPDYFQTAIMSTILGGGFSSRINMNIREKNGYAYGAGGGFSYNRLASLFFVGGSIRSDVTAESVHEILSEIKRIRIEDVTTDELSREKEGAILSLPSNWATGAQVLSSYRSLIYFGLPLDYYKTYVPSIQKVEATGVRKVASQYLKPDEAQILVVGDAKTVLPKLEEMLKGELKGDLVVLDADGKKIR